MPKDSNERNQMRKYRGETSTDPRLRRRDYVASGTAVGMGLLAGCLGDDDPEDLDDDDAPEDIPAEADDDPSDDENGDEIVIDDGEDADEVEDEVERYDVMTVRSLGPPVPADVETYEFIATGWGAKPSWVGAGYFGNMLASRSLIDVRPYPWEVESWQYEPGILEFTLRDDVYWWSGKPVDTEDLVTVMELLDWHHGGNDLDAHPNVIAREAIDEQTARFSLADTWREEWAIQQTILDERIWGSYELYEPWVEQFHDTGGEMDAVEDVRENLTDHQVNTDDELVHHFRIPFEFRLDGSIGEIGEDYWEFELIPEKNGHTRAYADQINWTKHRFTAEEEPGVRREDRFLEGDEVMDDYMNWEGQIDDIPFETKVTSWTGLGPFGPFGWNMNIEVHPSDNPFFRRAWNFATRRTDWERPDTALQEIVGHPWLTDEHLRTWVSDDVIADFTRYGNDADWDRTEEELERGGFEQDGDGRWLNQDTGEPLEIDVFYHGWYPWIADFGMDWFADLEDFGIRTEVTSDRPETWAVEGVYVGGFTPEWVFDQVFGELNLWGGLNIAPGFGESVQAPPLGATDAPQDEWIEYDTRTIADRLAVTIDDDTFQGMVDQLAWVSNQLVPRSIVVALINMRIFNNEYWSVTVPEENPDQWIRTPEHMAYFDGRLSYVPEEER